MLQVGDVAPDFQLPDQNNHRVQLSSFKGKNLVVLFFYPKDDTPGCTKESCTFRDNHPAFEEVGARVFGVSSDSIKSHAFFAKKHSLSYPLLSDEKGEVRGLYGAYNLRFIPARASFVIDKEGIIRHVFSSQGQAEKHVEETLRAVQKIANENRAQSAIK